MVLFTKSKLQAVWEGEALTLLCKADGAESLLSVEWWHFPQGRTQQEFVAGMRQDGTVQLGPSSKGHARLEKIDWATFQLEISSTTITDSGVYECRVSESTQNLARDWSWTQKLAVTVKSLGRCQRNPILNLHIIGTFLCSGMQWNLIVCHHETPNCGMYTPGHRAQSLAAASVN